MKSAQVIPVETSRLKGNVSMVNDSVWGLLGTIRGLYTNMVAGSYDCMGASTWCSLLGCSTDDYIWVDFGRGSKVPELYLVDLIQSH